MLFDYPTLESIVALLSKNAGNAVPARNSETNRHNDQKILPSPPREYALMIVAWNFSLPM